MRFERGKSFTEAWLQSLRPSPTQEGSTRSAAPLLDHSEIMACRQLSPSRHSTRQYHRARGWHASPAGLRLGAAFRYRRDEQGHDRHCEGRLLPRSSNIHPTSRCRALVDLYATRDALPCRGRARRRRKPTLRIHEDRLPSATVVAKDRYQRGFPSQASTLAWGPPVTAARSRLPGLQGAYCCGRASPPRAVAFSRRLEALLPVISWCAPARFDCPMRAGGRSRSACSSASLAVGYFYLRCTSSTGPRPRRSSKTLADWRMRKPLGSARKRRQRKTKRSRAAPETGRKPVKWAQANQAKREASPSKPKDAARARRNEASDRPSEDGKLRAGNGDHPGAIAQYDEAIRLDPNLAAAYLQRGISLANMGSTRARSSTTRVPGVGAARG